MRPDRRPSVRTAVPWQLRPGRDGRGRVRIDHRNASAERGWPCGVGLERSTPPGGRGRGAVNDVVRVLVKQCYPIRLMVISTDPSVFLTSIDSFAFGNSTVR